MEDTPQKTTGIPRLSRLPRPPSGIPKPNSTLPRPTSIVRPSPSRESLVGTSGIAARGLGASAATETKEPKLRSFASRDQLRTAPSHGAAPRNPRLRASASRDQLVSATHGPPRSATPRASRPTSQASALNSSRVATTPSRKPSTTFQASPRLDEEPQPSADTGEADQVIFKRRLTLTRRPSESFSTASFQEYPDVADDNDGLPSAIEEHDALEQLKIRPLRPRQSLSERTMETLANIPSSPALKKKSSSFFDQAQSRPRSSSRLSRPGSSYNSDGSERAPSRGASRPGSSRGGDDHRPQNFKSSISGFKAPLTPIDGTPQSRYSSKPSAQTPSLRKASSRASLSAASKLPSIEPTASNDTISSPTPGRKTYAMLPPKTGAKTISSKPLRPRGSVNGLFKKPSLPNVAVDETRGSKASTSRLSDVSWDGTIPPASSTTGNKVATANAANGSAKIDASRKSSAALRDHIAKAKAAQRAAIKQSTITTGPSQTGQSPIASPIIPSDDGFDFGMADPFNSRRGESSSKKILQQRVSAARSSGKLNIAALGLKDMPADVTKMYDLSSTGDGSWAESVDLTRLVAADNEFETLDDELFPDVDFDSLQYDDDSEPSYLFGGLETLDLHGNLLVSVPLGFRRLSQLTSLNLSSNRLTNDCLEVIGQVTSLRDLKLAKNLLLGPLPDIPGGLQNLEILDLHGNSISALPSIHSTAPRLRILNLSENSIAALPKELWQLPLTELNVKKNRLVDTLIDEPIDSLPRIQTLDVSANQLKRLIPLGSAINLPELHVLSLSMNRLQGLPDMTTWSNLLTLSVDENSISSIPNSFLSLEKLRHADFSSNDIRVVPPEISRMTNLSMIRLSGNPLRDKKFVSITTEELKNILITRLEPPPPYNEGLGADGQPMVPGFLIDAKVDSTASKRDENDDDSRSDDDFATPPTSAPQSPSRSRSQTVSSLRSRSHTLSNQTWPVQQGGLLDRSRTELSTLHPVVCSKVAAEHRVKQVHLHHNLFSSIPNSLSFFADTLVSLSLANNQLVGEAYLLGEDFSFPSMKELNLSANRVTSLEPLVEHFHAPLLEKLDVSVNRINALPPTLTTAFPALKVLLAATNQIIDLDPDTIRGLKTVDASSNDISHLNPRIGLLGGSGGLEKLDVRGNRFRIPRWNVLERGTDATLRYLRGRVDVAEMAAWKGANNADAFSDLD